MISHAHNFMASDPAGNPEDSLSSVFSRLRSTLEAMRKAEEGFWVRLAAEFTPTQQAKLLLKTHSPESYSQRRECIEVEKALKALSRKVEAGASDAEIAPALAAARQALTALSKLEDGYWDAMMRF